MCETEASIKTIILEVLVILDKQRPPTFKKISSLRLVFFPKPITFKQATGEPSGYNNFICEPKAP